MSSVPQGKVANFESKNALLCDSTRWFEVVLSCKVHLHGDISIGRERQKKNVVELTLLVPRSFPFPGWSFAARAS